jgi:hypothetical protein
MPNANLTKYLGGVYYTDTKLFNNPRPTIKRLNYDIKVFKPALKDHLLPHSYSIILPLVKYCELHAYLHVKKGFSPLVLKFLSFTYIYM